MSKQKKLGTLKLTAEELRVRVRKCMDSGLQHAIQASRPTDVLPDFVLVHANLLAFARDSGIVPVASAVALQAVGQT